MGAIDSAAVGGSHRDTLWEAVGWSAKGEKRENAQLGGSGEKIRATDFVQHYAAKWPGYTGTSLLSKSLPV
jgi:hypothetical protein